MNMFFKSSPCPGRLDHFRRRDAKNQREHATIVQLVVEGEESTRSCFAYRQGAGVVGACLHQPDPDLYRHYQLTEDSTTYISLSAG